jgi:phenylpropionate dioxygenase-like ring-hydroxylating dioxygenase large terminal subunit
MFASGEDIVKQMEIDAVPIWARGSADPAFFEREQAQLGTFWTLLGLTTDTPRDGDWFRASLGGRSVFVQRFGDTLRGFENVCMHRFYPLRTADRGNGPIRCGFHHWQYNKDGLAVGIPKCLEMFGVTPRELNARLTPIEIATCGSLIFGRFASPEHQETLEDYLADGFPILQAMWSLQRAPYTISTTITANWKFGLHISLDDYHLVAVHPSTFGKNGYLATNSVCYFRFGAHSAYFHGADENALADMVSDCRQGSYQPPDYRIFQFFPNLIAVHFEAARNWFVLIQQYVPLAADRTLLRSWYCRAPFKPAERGTTHRLLRIAAAPWLPLIVPFYMRKITSEDNAVCERMQPQARHMRGRPILGRHEERIGWFEETYAQALGEPGYDVSEPQT